MHCCSHATASAKLTVDRKKHSIIRCFVALDCRCPVIYQPIRHQPNSHGPKQQFTNRKSKHRHSLCLPANLAQRAAAGRGQAAAGAIHSRLNMNKWHVSCSDWLSCARNCQLGKRAAGLRRRYRRRSMAREGGGGSYGSYYEPGVDRVLAA